MKHTIFIILTVSALLFSGWASLVKETHQEKPKPPLDIPPNTTIHKDLVYGKTVEKDLLLDLYIPESESVLPLVIWVHGGAWLAGNKEDPKHALQLLYNGFALASINYRLSQEAIFPAQIIDCKTAVRWLRANADKYHFNASRIGAWGSSAGGHLVSLMGTSAHIGEWDQGEHLEQSSTIQAVCDWFGPSDFLRMDDYPGTMVHLIADSPESKLIGGDIRENPEKVQAANPITYITKDDPPFLIMHGKTDGTVIHQQSILLQEALSAKGVPSELILIEDTGHGGKNWDDQLQPVIVFFTEALKN